MVDWVLNNRHSPIGIELGSRSVQLVQFSADGSRLLDAARWDLSPPGSAEEARTSTRPWSEAIRHAREGRKFRGREAVVCLSAGDLFVQNIRVPKGPNTELPKIIAQEAAGRLPFPMAEAEIRFLVAGDVRQGDQTKREVVVLACHRDMIERSLEIVDGAGLRARAMDIEPAALLRSYVRQFRREGDASQRIMYVRFGAETTAVVIAQGMEVYFVKYIELGGNQMDEAVASLLQIPVDEAALLRRHNGDRRADQQDPEVNRSVQEATRSVLERLVNELSLCVRYHSVTFRGQTLSRIVLGGSEAVQSLVGALAMRLDIKCELGDPLRSYETLLPPTRRGQWDVAAGLALKNSG